MISSPLTQTYIWAQQQAASAAAAAAVAAASQPQQMTQMIASPGSAVAGTGVADHPVLIVSNLDPERTACDELFTLFGVYGNVQRVKILFNKKDTAFVQMADSAQAELAAANLQKAPLHGKQMSVNFSRYTAITMPKSASAASVAAASAVVGESPPAPPAASNPQGEGADLTRDYTNSPLHRFKIRGSKNFQHICPPSSTLHVSNICTSVSTEADLQLLFSNSGTVVRARFFPKDRKMALVEMDTTASAIEALVALHDRKFGHTSLRVSFTKSVV
jgi:polypyrimidine tract-binding protein 2